MSRISITKKIGKTEFTFWADDEDFREELALAAFYGTTPDECGICNSKNVELGANRTQEGYLYVKVRCQEEDCRAASTLGVYKEAKGGFWKKFEKYEPQEGAEAPVEKAEKKKATKKKEKSEDKDYPF